MVHQKSRRKRPGKERRLVGQAVKTPASHAGNTGSIPVRVTKGANEEGQVKNKIKKFKKVLARVKKR